MEAWTRGLIHPAPDLATVNFIFYLPSFMKPVQSLQLIQMLERLFDKMTSFYAVVVSYTLHIFFTMD